MIDLLITAITYIFIQMLVVWLIAIVIKNPSIIDVAWALGLMVTGLIYLSPHELDYRLIVISLLLVGWGTRLSVYLWYTRVRKGIIDQRYIKLSENWKIKKSLGFLLNFQLQGFFILVISSVFLFASTNSPHQLNEFDWLAVTLVLIGILGETIADYQLYHFQQQNKKQVCNLGFWFYSRHPNYFFEWLTWCGFSVFGLQHSFGYIGLLSPILLYVIMTKITGPLTEQGSITSKGEAYLNYQKITPMFFPFKKSGSNK